MYVYECECVRVGVGHEGVSTQVGVGVSYSIELSTSVIHQLVARPEFTFSILVNLQMLPVRGITM